MADRFRTANCDGDSVNVVRLASRIALVCVVIVVAGLVTVQFERIAERHVAVSRQLAQSRVDLTNLREELRRQRRTIDRLSDPHGAIPEIHEQLHLVRPNEQILYVKNAPALPGPTPEP